MAYHITYGKVSIRKQLIRMRGTKQSRTVMRYFLFGILVILILAARFGALDFLIPGNPKVTKDAFYKMVENVSDGESVNTAITAFCHEILGKDGIE